MPEQENYIEINPNNLIIPANLWKNAGAHINSTHALTKNQWVSILDAFTRYDSETDGNTERTIVGDIKVYRNQSDDNWAIHWSANDHWRPLDRNYFAIALENYLQANGHLEEEVQNGAAQNEADDAAQEQPQVPAAREVPSTLPRNLILQGAPGTGKTHLARQLAHWLIKGGGNRHPIPTIDAAIKQIKSPDTYKDQVNADLKGSKNFKMVQFHPATSYEDFVRGIRAKTEDKSVTYEVEHGHLSEMCKEAADNPTKNYVLLIDEINRANLPAVLGECIFALEYRGQSVDTAYAPEPTDRTTPTSKKLTIPENLWIIGTMNTADRSVGHLDYAIRRRFLFVDCLGDERKVDEAARATFNKINKIIKEYRSEEFEEKDIQIGHTYFMEADWKTRLKYQVKPILEEYLRDGVLKPSAKEAVAGL